MGYKSNWLNGLVDGRYTMRPERRPTGDGDIQTFVCTLRPGYAWCPDCGASGQDEYGNTCQRCDGKLAI